MRRHILKIAAWLFICCSSVAAKAQPSEGLCLYQKYLYVGTHALCNSVGGTLIWASTTEPTRSEVVALVQFGLVTFGYDPGPIDGLEGQKTQKAIQVFMSAYGLRARTIADDGVIERVFYRLDEKGHFKQLAAVTQKADDTSAATAAQRDAAAKAFTNVLRRFRR